MESGVIQTEGWSEYSLLAGLQPPVTRDPRHRECSRQDTPDTHTRSYSLLSVVCLFPKHLSIMPHVNVGPQVTTEIV